MMVVVDEVLDVVVGADVLNVLGEWGMTRYETFMSMYIRVQIVKNEIQLTFVSFVLLWRIKGDNSVNIVRQ